MNDDQILELLAKHGGNVEQLLPSRCADREALVFLLREGLIRIRHRVRQKNRERIKLEELSSTGIRPTSTMPRYDYPQARKAIRARTLSMLTSWMIGDVVLADMHKSGLLAEAAKESASGNGHYVNARFYEALAEPMNDSEMVRDHWQDEGARLLHQSLLDEIVRHSPRTLPRNRPSAPPPQISA